MKKLNQKLPTIARLVLGLVFTVFGLNGFFGFLPQPPLPEEAGSFLAALGATGYLFPMIKGIEVLAGIALLSNRFVPLALILLAPIVVNIAAFHLVLAPGSLGLIIAIVGLGLYLAWAHRDAYRGVLAVRTPARAELQSTPSTLARSGAPAVSGG
jgi:uncharacterized membrane protein YphA (DoxX/SURF4 family)